MTHYSHFEKDQQVTIYDIDHKGFLKPEAIFNYFQDIATQHSVELGVSYFDLIKLNEFWVLTRVVADIVKLPKYNDQLKLVTFPVKPRLIDCDRDYYIFNSQGELMIKGVSKWVILDTETRQIKRVSPDRFPPENCLKPERAIENPQWKVPIVPSTQKTSQDYSKVVALGDIDFNMHMNNSRYLSHAYDVLTESDTLGRRIKTITVNYLKEMAYNTNYYIRKNTDENRIIINFFKDDEVFFRCCFEFDDSEN